MEPGSTFPTLDTFHVAFGQAVRERIPAPGKPMSTSALPHLDVLEAESIHIMREVVAESSRPAMLYSVGKDSSVMLRLAQKAFYPGEFPSR